MINKNLYSGKRIDFAPKVLAPFVCFAIKNFS